jgi:flagellar basal-body rod protein FlgG
MTLQQFYIGATGMDAFQKDLMNITNNVANAQTYGYKQARVEYENLFPQILEEVIVNYENGNTKPSGIEMGTGVKISAITKDFKQGNVEQTGKPLDIAIQGDGFFQIKRVDGEIAYTRAGNFQKDSEGNLTDASGHFIEPPIKIPEFAKSVSIDAEGKVLVQESDSSEALEVGQITIARFSNPSGLQSIGQNLFVETASSGEPVVGVPGRDNAGTLAQGALEFSNVDIISEMMRMVITQRAFEIVSKLIQTGEKMLTSATEVARTS